MKKCYFCQLDIPTGASCWEFYNPKTSGVIAYSCALCHDGIAQRGHGEDGYNFSEEFKA